MSPSLRALSALLAIAAAAACASSSDPGDAGDPLGDRFRQPTVRVTDNTGRMVGSVTYSVQDNVVVQVLEGPPDATWPHLLSAYEALGIDPEVRDEENLTAGVNELRARRRLGDRRLSRYFSCGQARTGAIADQANLRIRMVSVLRALSDGRTELRTSAAAYAVATDGAGRDTYDCTSVRALEVAIGEHVAAALAGGG